MNPGTLLVSDTGPTGVTLLWKPPKPSLADVKRYDIEFIERRGSRWKRLIENVDPKKQEPTLTVQLLHWTAEYEIRVTAEIMSGQRFHGDAVRKLSTCRQKVII